MGIAVALLASFTLIACGSAPTRRVLSARFQALHACEAESVRPTERGYVVVGCGIQAHYVCRWSADRLVLMPGRHTSCVETNVNRESPQQPSRIARVVRDTDEDGSVHLSATSSFPGGSVTFEALPERFPGRAVVRLFVLRADPDDTRAECTGDLWIEGERVNAHESVIEPVPGGALYSLLVDLSALDRMGGAQRIAARACGVEVVIEAPAGRLAHELAIRAREASSASRP